MTTDELQSYFAQQAKQDRNETQGLSSLINTFQTQDDYKKCYKPYRTLNNYWLIMTLIYSNTNTSRSYLTCDIVTQIAKFNRVKPSNYHQFNKTNHKVISNIKLASFFQTW